MKAFRRCRAFTLIETVLAVALFGFLAGAIYMVSTAALDATRITLEEQVSQERLGSFLRASRNAFANVPATGEVFLRFETGGSSAIPELVFRGAGVFLGIPGLAGGEVILSAPPQADGTRSFSLKRIPPAISGSELEEARKAAGIPLLPRVEKVEWAFFIQQEWREEWPQGSGRPELVRLRFFRRDEPEFPVEAVFWIPPLEQGSGGSKGGGSVIDTNAP